MSLGHFLVLVGFTGVVTGRSFSTPEDFECKGCCEAWVDPNCNRDHCWAWAHKHSQCNSNADYMIAMCGAACEDADNSPEKHVESCHYWANIGHCVKFKEYMEKHCRMACDELVSHWDLDDQQIDGSEEAVAGSEVEGSSESAGDEVDGVEEDGNVVSKASEDSEDNCGIEVRSFTLKGDRVVIRKRVADACACADLCQEMPFWSYKIKQGSCRCYDIVKRMELKKVVKKRGDKKPNFVMRRMEECSHPCPWRNRGH